MAKRPYIQFYIGDYLKDTRILPLNVRGAWVDLLLYMWDADPRGELTGTMEEFSRLMCCSQDEAILVIQTLKQKDIFGYHELSDGRMRIVSRKQKKMVKLSETRVKSGLSGGNPALLKPKENILVNQDDKLNAEYEYIYSLLGFETISNEEAKTLAMVVVEMMTIWMDRKPDYKVYKELDYHACLRIAYLIAGVKGFRFVDVTREKESEVLKSWEKISLFIANHTFYTTLTLDAIGNDKMFQKIETSMREAKNNHGGAGMPADVTLAEARKNFKSQLPKE